LRFRGVQRKDQRPGLKCPSLHAAQLFYLVAGRRGKWSKPDLSRNPLALRQDGRYRPRQASSRLRLQPRLSSDSEHAVAAGQLLLAAEIIGKSPSRPTNRLA